MDPDAEKLAKKIVDHYFVDINRFVRIKALTKGLQDAVEELIRELHENRVQKEQEEVEGGR
ncbi:unnamed protein product [marine sediment metagenome]|uniref:Uncharacterized protein n=1 Tax=marine sediment metagenome TaxID=412755 RepID=X0WD77_9ZZZZ